MFHVRGAAGRPDRHLEEHRHCERGLRPFSDPEPPGLGDVEAGPSERRHVTFHVTKRRLDLSTVRPSFGRAAAVRGDDLHAGEVIQRQWCVDGDNQRILERVPTDAIRPASAGQPLGIDPAATEVLPGRPAVDRPGMAPERVRDFGSSVGRACRRCTPVSQWRARDGRRLSTAFGASTTEPQDSAVELAPNGTRLVVAPRLYRGAGRARPPGPRGRALAGPGREVDERGRKCINESRSRERQVQPRTAPMGRGVSSAVPDGRCSDHFVDRSFREEPTAADLDGRQLFLLRRSIDRRFARPSATTRSSTL